MMGLYRNCGGSSAVQAAKAPSALNPGFLFVLLILAESAGLSGHAAKSLLTVSSPHTTGSHAELSSTALLRVTWGSWRLHES